MHPTNKTHWKKDIEGRECYFEMCYDTLAEVEEIEEIWNDMDIRTYVRKRWYDKHCFFNLYIELEVR